MFFQNVQFCNINGVCRHVQFFNNHPWQGYQSIPTDYDQYMQQYHAEQYQHQLNLYQQQCAEHKRLQEEYYQQYYAKAAATTPKEEPGATTTNPKAEPEPIPMNTTTSKAPAPCNTGTNPLQQQSPASTPAPIPMPPTPPMPPAPPPKRVPKPSSESGAPYGRGGWMPRAVALQAAVEMGLHPRIQHLLKSNRQYSSTFRNQLDAHKEQVKRWGQDPNYDFWSQRSQKRYLLISILVSNGWIQNLDSNLKIPNLNLKFKFKSQNSKFEFKIWIQISKF